jgi:peptidoglycan/xylan/chitin deacetylase (PgdA/CDA1 family)
MKVSVIIPAHNAAATIAETLDSLCAQTYTDWEAIVVDDGSSDATASVVGAYAARDARIQLIRQPQAGVSEARNAGVRLARFDWLLFLDSDDWILPEYLDRMTTVLEADPTLDAVHCGWNRVAGDGSLLAAQFCPVSADLFPVFARTCAVAIHACIVRRSLVQAVGEFDSSLRVGEDWDLWLRIARVGARFGAVPEALARYRIRPGSASSNAAVLLEQTLVVLERGHAPDARVANLLPAYAQGMPRDQLPEIKLYIACWAAGLALGAGHDVGPLLDLVAECNADLDPSSVARMIFETAPIATGRPTAAWIVIWPGLRHALHAFLIDLQAQTQTANLAQRSEIILERMILDQANAERPLLLSQTYSVLVEITDPIFDLVPPAPVERLHCVVEVEGRRLGTIELPICDGRVLAWVLADALAARFAWAIVGRFFARTIYRSLRVEQDTAGISIWRDSLCLAHEPTGTKPAFWKKVHDLIGWTIFLQELWGHKEWLSDQFYDPHMLNAAARREHAGEAWLTLDLADDICDIEVVGPSLDLAISVGESIIGALTIPSDQGIVRAQSIRAAVTSATGMELCRAVVREGLIGRPFKGSDPLRARLAAAAARRADSMVIKEPAQMMLVSGDASIGAINGQPLVPGLAAALRRMIAPGERTTIIGRHISDQIGTSVSRRASLPAVSAPELARAAAAFGAPVISIPWLNATPKRLLYAPDVIWQSPRAAHACASRSAAARTISRSTDGDRLAGRLAETPARATSRLPILIYQRVAPSGSPALSRHRVTPEAFEQQLCHLRDTGYYSVSLDDWRVARELRRPLPGRAIHITFDDGYCDFMTYAWPLLRKYGFSASVFVATDAIGGSSTWDQRYGEVLPLLGWNDLRWLHTEGIVIGAHSASHTPLTALSITDIVREVSRARATLERGLGIPVTSFAYPYGDQDEVVRHLVGACGYIFGLAYLSGMVQFDDQLLALPRIEIAGSDTLEQFVTKLSW